MSFDPGPIAWLKENAPDLIRGIVAESHYAGAHWAKLPETVRRDLATHAHAPRTEPDFVSWARGGPAEPGHDSVRAAAKPVICWTVRTDDERVIGANHADQVTFEGYLA